MKGTGGFFLKDRRCLFACQKARIGLPSTPLNQLWGMYLSSCMRDLKSRYVDNAASIILLRNGGVLDLCRSLTRG